jgi:ubiquitin-protein ligase E3 C
LTQLSAKLPINNIDAIGPDIEKFTVSLSQEHQLHLLANLLMFAPPRYATFAATTLELYILMLASLLDSLPVNAFETSPEISTSETWLQGSRNDGADSSSDDEGMVEDITGPSRPSASRTQALPQPSSSKSLKLDSKTRTRMQTLINQKHMGSLLQTTSKHERARNQFFRFVLSLCRAWPAQSEKAIHAVFAGTGLGFMREIYRGYVRGSPLGKSDELKKLTGMLYYTLLGFVLEYVIHAY